MHGTWGLVMPIFHSWLQQADKWGEEVWRRACVYPLCASALMPCESAGVKAVMHGSLVGFCAEDGCQSPSFFFHSSCDH